MSRRSQDVIAENRTPYVPGADTDERFRAALASSLDAVFLLESIRDCYGGLETFRLVEVNERGADMFGAPRDTMLGRTAEELVAGDPTRGLFNRAARVVATGESLDEVIDLRQIPVKPD
ncbi:MAG: PAS domain-containing protein, partial [Gemmatimonadaceae bacterium]|nr:PAS domain-containing protein [Gemmatimonadaceae bacterium]